MLALPEGSPTPQSAIDWYARGGRHSDSVPCEGTSLKGILRINGIGSMAEGDLAYWRIYRHTRSA